MPITGYSNSRLLRASGDRARVYEAQGDDGREVVVKIIEGMSEVEGKLLELELEKLRAIAEPCFVIPELQAIEQAGEQGVALVRERVPGLTLTEFRGRVPLAVDTFLPIARQLAELLVILHGKGIVHRALRPCSVWITADCGKLFLTDFGLLAAFERRRPNLDDAREREVVVPYLAPEQSGWSLRPVDPRSDLYSLGAIFYELLTGAVPFAHEDADELLAALLADVPSSPSAQRPEIPEVLSRLILKLLEKQPERRYQRADSLVEDLLRIKQLLDEDENEDGFVLAQGDRRLRGEDGPALWATIAGRMVLRGRDRERALLAGELERSASGDKARLVLVSGEAGVGKSALCAELAELTHASRGLFGRGQVDGQRPAVPYGVWLHALDGVCEQLLSASVGLRKRWRARLRGQLGALVSVLTPLLPKLAALLGDEHAPVPPLEPSESRNRLRLAFSRLLAGLAAETPVVLVLDGLHGVDDGSLDLLKALFEGGSLGSLLVVGCYQPMEIYDGHPLLYLSAKLRDRSLRGRHLELGPLSDTGVTQLLADMLGQVEDGFSRTIIRHTGNNPRFVLESVRYLLIHDRLSRGSGERWSMDELEGAAAELPAGVKSMVRERLALLGEGERALLLGAACMPRHFSLEELSEACGLALDQLIEHLERLYIIGELNGDVLGIYLRDELVREVIYADARTARRREIHRRLGEAGRARAGLDYRFEVIDHIDAGIDVSLDLDDEGIAALVELNLHAGERALEMASYVPALRYLGLGAALLDRHTRRGGERKPALEQLGVGVEFARAQALTLAGRGPQADHVFEQLLERELDWQAFGTVVARRVRLLNLEDRPQEAVTLGLWALERCGYGIPESPGNLRAGAAMFFAWLRMRRRDLDALLALEPASEPEVVAAMEIIATLVLPAFSIDVRLMLMLGATHIKLMLAHGRHPTAPLALATLAMMVCAALRRPQAGCALIDAALVLGSERPVYQARTEVAAIAFIWQMGRSLARVAQEVEVTYQRTLELGDFELAGYLAGVGVSLRFDLGTDLRQLIELSREHERDIGSWASKGSRAVMRIYGSLAAALVGDIDAGLGALEARGGAPRVMPVDPLRYAEGPKLWRYSSSTSRAFFHMIMGEPEQALEIIDEIADYPRGMMGSSSVPRTALIHALAAASVHPTAAEPERRRLERIVDRSLAMLTRWTEACAENFEHLRLLVLAEREMLRGDYVAGFDAFEAARTEAEPRGCYYVAALACERMAAHMQARGLRTAANGPLREAWGLYQRWGARAKQYLIEREMEISFEPIDGHSNLGLSRATIDLDAVTTALAAVSEELDLDAVVSKALEVAMANTGADRGALLLESDAGLELVALGGVARRVQVLSPPLELTSAAALVPLTFVNHMLRTGKTLVIEDARVDTRFARDAYVDRTGVRSLLCMPLGKAQRRLGALVLENRQRASCFGEAQFQLLTLVAAQTSGAIDNANLYRALRRSEVQWRSLVDGAPDLIALLDTNGELTFVNRPLPGWTQGRAPAIEPVSAEPWRQVLEAALEHGRRGEVEIALNGRAGAQRWYDAHIAPVEIEDEPRRVMIIATEITERKLADARRLDLEAQLRQQQRLESIGTLASGVAHEINNPVQGILNYAELLGLSKEDPELVVEFSGEISNEAERVATIVRNLLAFSRRDTAPERAPTSLAEIVGNTLSLIHSTLRKDQISLELDVSDELPRVPCHAQQIQQILMNLVTNARDALNERWEGHHDDKRILIQGGVVEREDKRWARLSVIDTGAGMPEEVYAHIFDPFYTTKGRDQGTGLGLSVSHGIARDHGGDLWAESELGVGTKFHLELPLPDP
ncbi:AAA family ATPase [Pseudenhygromyxa sp. WMMC2535]|uniref:AAA family ATPase n=1 Tax=Pseudenhygromyxa sp. WMMC2535 TaxID=2712867 RepID=UPI001594EEC0|nr:AAA family ATPase [Pseudenhygromyxa sp. WMMC2535]